MRTDGDTLILEGQEVEAFNFLAMRLVKGEGVQAALKTMKRRFAGLDKVSRNSVASGVFRMMAVYIPMRSLRKDILPIDTYFAAVAQAKIELVPDERISHERQPVSLYTPTSVRLTPRPVIRPDCPGVYPLSGTAYPVGRMKQFTALSRTLSLDDEPILTEVTP